MQIGQKAFKPSPNTEQTHAAFNKMCPSQGKMQFYLVATAFSLFLVYEIGKFAVNSTEHFLLSVICAKIKREMK